MTQLPVAQKCIDDIMPAKAAKRSSVSAAAAAAAAAAALPAHF
jgi:hypothetical protein